MWLAAAWLCAATPARADHPGKAREAFTRASQHFELGEYREALDEFKEAYRNVNDPALLFNIGQCQRQLGERSQAIRSFRMYLIKRPDAPNADSVRETIARLEQEEQTHPTPAPAPSPTVAPATPPAASDAAPPLVTAPPVATPTPAATSTMQQAAVTAAPPAPTPVYKKPWLWATVGAVVVVGVALGVALPLGLAPHTPTSATDLGTVRF